MTSSLIYALTDDTTVTLTVKNKNSALTFSHFLSRLCFFSFFLFLPLFSFVLPLYHSLFCFSHSVFLISPLPAFFIFLPFLIRPSVIKPSVVFCRRRCCHYYYLNINSSLCLCFQIWVTSPENALCSF